MNTNDEIAGASRQLAPVNMELRACPQVRRMCLG